MPIFSIFSQTPIAQNPESNQATPSLNQRPSYQQIFQGQLRLSLWVSLFLTLFLIFFFSKAPAPLDFRQWSYVLSCVSYYWLPILTLPLLLFPLIWLGFLRYILVIILWALTILFLVDAFVFNYYAYHLEPTVIRIIFIDFKGLGLPGSLTALIFAGFFIWLAAIFFFYRRLEKKTLRKGLTKTYTAIFFLSLFLFSWNCLVNIWANWYAREEIILYGAYLPLYRSITSHRLAPTIPIIAPNLFPPVKGSAIDFGPSKSNDFVNYPLAKPQLDLHDDQERPNVLLIVLESFQAASMTSEITPNLFELSQTSSNFNKHISSGSATVPGLFGLLYGVHPTLYDTIKYMPLSYPSALTEALNQAGYEIRVFSSSNLERYQFRSMVFSHVEEKKYYSGTDSMITNAFINTIDPKSRPRFDFVFFFSSHYPYYYPKNFTKFEPTPNYEGGFILNRLTDPKPPLNAYHNSLYYSDSLVGKIFQALKTKSLFDKTWIIVTGDHAEEFNENGLGFWGHGSNFGRWQTSPPMIVKRPYQTQKIDYSNLSLHQDLAPTLLEEILNCQTPASLYSDGQNLFKLPPTRPTIISSYFDTAYVKDDIVIEKLRMKRYNWFNLKPLTKASDEESWLKSMMEMERRFTSPKNKN